MKPVSGKRMCKLSEARGWLLDRIAGSHHIFYHPATRRRTTVPVRGAAELKPKTQRSIMRDAGIIDSDL